MADIRIKDLPTTASQTGSDDYLAIDGSVNGTRKMSASAPSFNGNITSGGAVAVASGTNTAPSITFTADTNTGLYLDATNVLGVATNGSGTVLFSSSAGIGKIKAHSTRVLALEAGTGNASITLTPSGTGGVGIGTSSPNAPLEVNGTIRNSTSAQQISTHNIDVLSSSTAANLFNSIANATITIGGGITSGNVKIGTSTGGLTVLGSSSSGYVGIGTTTPNNQLVISNAGAAGFEFTPSNGTFFTYNRQTGAYSPIGMYGSTVVIAIGGSGLNAISIDASSNTTFAGTVTTAGRLNVAGGPDGAVAAGNAQFAAQGTNGAVISGQGSVYDSAILNKNASVAIGIPTGTINTVFNGAATFAGTVAIGNTVAAGVAVASTHKVTMVIGGVTYYLLASNV